ncbi:glycosyltransferase family 1 protein [Pectobacterium cacticida]|uniref:glycosyltransferase family 4 protein n=1 Tax=Pectobacterium cacticida TaxID=69221 RepID=UPI002FF04D17
MRKIYIDTRWENLGGIGTFSKEINKIINFPNIEIKGKPFSPVDTFRTAFYLVKKRDMMVFFPGYIPPFYSRIPFVFTIHDLNHLDRPENSSFFKRIYYNFIIKRGCHKAKKILTVSEFSRARIIEWSGVAEERVINVGNGVSPIFSPDGDQIDYDFEYFLCVSNRKLHKNELGTLEAFKQAALPGTVKLVFTGNTTDQILKKIEELGLAEKVIFTGFVDDEELPKLYRSAVALIFVSLYEGFGLPVIEAMASGIPVITSKTTSLGEIAGDAAMLVDPNNITEISGAISNIYNDEILREGLISKGLVRARKYNWEDVARKVHAALTCPE